jgi:hypothetical protein
VNRILVASTLIVLALPAGRASAIPAFARKYETSCETCHTVYPYLNPFGEAFRRNGYRFPGVDSDLVKQPVVTLGQEAYKQTFPESVWPDWIASSVPLAAGVNGQVVFHPDRDSGGGIADNRAAVVFSGLVDEVHLWAGGSFDDTTTFFAELTFSESGVEIEHAKILFNDLIGPKHAVNLTVGKSFQTLTSFGVHSAYIADLRVPAAPVPQLWGGTTDAWNVAGQYSGLELAGVIAGRFNYSLGVNAGASVDISPPETAYAHVGFKLGGLRLDGEEAEASAAPKQPWAEDALTVDLFAVHSNTRFTNLLAETQQDIATTAGLSLRGQLGSLTLDSGFYWQHDGHGTADRTETTTWVQYDELSYVALPWLVPAARAELFWTSPSGGPTVHDFKIVIGAAALIRANIKLVLTAQLETALGLPDGGWSPVGGFAAPADATTGVSVEIESLMLTFAWAF